MSISDLLGGNLPQGTSINVKLGAQQEGNANLAAPASRTAPPTGTQKTSVPEGDTAAVNQRKANCESKGGTWIINPFFPNIGHCKMPKNHLGNVQKEKCEAAGGTWVANPMFPNLGRCEMPNQEELAQRVCEEKGGQWVNGECVMPPEITPPGPGPGPTPTPTPQKACEAKGGQWINNECVMPDDGKGGDGSITPTEPILPTDPRTDPSPFEDAEYYDWLTQETYKQEMQYWGTQKDTINATMEQGWNDIEAMLANEGYHYSDRRMQLAGEYRAEWTRLLNSAYQDIMYTGLDRHMKQQETALNFFLGNKQLDIQYQLGQGQLTLDQLRLAVEEKLGMENLRLQAEQLGINQQELELAIFRAATERAASQAATAQTWEQLRQNWMTIAIQLGMGEEEARTFFDDLFSQYSGGEF